LPLLTPNLGWLSSSSLVPLGRLPISAATASQQDRLPPSCASCSRLRLLSLHPTPTLLKGSDQLGNDRWSRDEQYTLFCGCVAGWAGNRCVAAVTCLHHSWWDGQARVKNGGRPATTPPPMPHNSGESLHPLLPCLAPVVDL
jgi:hypothetical protein